jgi:hypothetical protein
MNSTQSALANVIFACIISMTILGVMSFYKQPYNPEAVTRIIESLGGVVLACVTAKAGLSIPSSEKQEKPTDTTPDKK